MDMSTSLFLSLLLLLLSSINADTSIPGTINRALKQQILVNIPPHETSSAAPFLTSPSGKYAADFNRRPTAPGAGGLGNDFCFVQVVDTSGHSVWESECAPVSTANACTLVFDNAGLEIFDGSRSSWDTSANSDNFLKTIELVDEGDMRIRDQDGNLVWRASDNPRAGQQCGYAGAPGLAYPAHAPFAGPFPRNQPFGQQVPQQNGPGGGVVGAGGSGVGLGTAMPPAADESSDQQQLGIGAPVAGTGVQHQPLGVGVGGSSDGNVLDNPQPLVDNTPFNSKAAPISIGSWLKMGSSLLLGLGAWVAAVF